METYQSDKRTLLQKVKGGIRERISEEISHQSAKRAAFKDAKRRAEIDIAKTKARYAAAERGGVTVRKKSYVPIDKPKRTFAGDADEMAARRKRLFGV